MTYAEIALLRIQAMAEALPESYAALMEKARRDTERLAMLDFLRREVSPPDTGDEG